MVYLIVKDRYKPGCFAIQEELGEHFGEFYDKLLDADAEKKFEDMVDAGWVPSSINEK